MALYSRLLKSTHQQYSKKLARETEQKRLLVAMLKKHGRFKMRQGGNFYEWRVRYKEHPFFGLDDMEVLTWNRQDTYQIALLDWREVAVKDVISKREVQLNKGKEAILRIYDEKMEILKHDFISGFSDNLWQDGNAVGRQKFFHGLESIFADDNATAAGDEYAQSADNYSGLSTVPGAYGNAVGQPGYGFWSPTLVNSTVGGTTWAASADQMIRKGILATTFGNSADLMVDFVCMTRLAYRQAITLFDEKERIIIEKGEDNDLVSLGFKAVEFEGIPLTWEFGIPETPANPVAKTVRAYGINVTGMNLMFCHDSQDICEGSVFFDEDQRAYKFIVESLGNLIIREPRHQLKIADYA